MKKFLQIFAFIIALSGFSFAQSSVNNCPTLNVTGPAGIPTPGAPLEFSADVNGIDVEKLGFNWTVSGGKILRGQGTSKISVSTEKWKDIDAMATVEVEGFPAGCSNVDSETAGISYCPTSVLVEAYGEIPFLEEKKRLAGIDFENNFTEGTLIYFIIDIPENPNLGKLKNRITAIRKYLFETRKIPQTDIIFLYNKTGSVSTNVYFVPLGSLYVPTAEFPVELNL